MNTPLKRALYNLGLRKMAAANGMVMPPPDLPIVENSQEEFSPEELAALEAKMEEAQAQQDAAPIDGEGENVAAEATGVDGSVVEMLIKAYCAEICAAWQYEWARMAALGTARNYLVSECAEHRDEELEHASQIADLLDSLGGVVPFTLSEIEKLNPTPAAPEDPRGNRYTNILASQLVAAEQAAVDLYAKIAEATKEGGREAAMVNNLVVDILTTEQKHVADMIKVSYAIGG